MSVAFGRKHEFVWQAAIDAVAQSVRADAQFASPVFQAKRFAVVSEHPYLTSSSRSRCSSQRLLKCPTLLQSVIKRFWVNANTTSPLGQALRFSVVGQQSRNAGVCHLCVPSCPFTVILRVALTVVHSLQCRSIKGPFAHVFKEIIKRLKPTVADCNSSCAIISVMAILSVVAAILHCLPHLIYGASRHATRLEVYASTCCDSSTSKVITSNHNGVSTFTQAKPVDLTIHMRELQNRQFAVFLSSFVFGVTGKFICCAIRHLNFLRRFVMVSYRERIVSMSNPLFIVKKEVTNG